MIIDIHGESLAVVEQAVTESADEQQVHSGWVCGDQSGDDPLQFVGFLEQDIHGAMYNPFGHDLQHYCCKSCWPSEPRSAHARRRRRALAPAPRASRRARQPRVSLAGAAPLATIRLLCRNSARARLNTCDRIGKNHSKKSCHITV
jgi:hypothetical protein